MAQIVKTVSFKEISCFVPIATKQTISWKCVETQEKTTTLEPAHEIMALFVFRKLILQTRTCSHPVGLDVWLLVGAFVYFHASCVRTAKALARLCGCAGSPEPSLVAYVISTIISWTGSILCLVLVNLFIWNACKLAINSSSYHYN